MKIKTISLVFSDLSEESAGLTIVLDPPLEDGTDLTTVEFEEQPCMTLANQVLAYLAFIKQQESQGEEENGGPGAIPETVH